jgi:hypothetical protein
MQRITDTTSAASLPAVPSLTGSIGYFTEGSPGTIAATNVRGWWLNMIQEELMSVLAAAGITPDTTGASLAQVAQAIGILGGNGQCRLNYTSSTVVTLSPFGGTRLRINGVSQPIPGSGVTLSNSGLSASTLYYVYASMSGSTMQLQASTSGHVTGTDGNEVKSGDATQTLVGMVYPAAGTPGVFTDTAAYRGVASWFNRRTRSIIGGSFSSQGTTSTSLNEFWTGVRIIILTWAEEAVQAIGNVIASNGTMGNSNGLAVSLDGATSGSVGQMYSNSNGQAGGITSAYAALVAEGAHYLTMLGNVSAGTATYTSGFLNGTLRI